MYYAMRASAPSLHRESTDSLIQSHSDTLLYSDIQSHSGTLLYQSVGRRSK